MRNRSAWFTCIAVLGCAKPSAAPPSERELIEGLLREIESSGATFVRNGKAHDAKEAADHLRMKWGRAGDRVKTAEDFIEHLASRSSFSGKPYEIRKDGDTTPAGEWLLARLELPQESRALGAFRSAAWAALALVAQALPRLPGSGRRDATFAASVGPPTVSAQDVMNNQVHLALQNKV